MASQIGQDRAAGQGFTNWTREGFNTGLHKSDKTALQHMASQIGHDRASRAPQIGHDRASGQGCTAGSIRIVILLMEFSIRSFSFLFFWKITKNNKKYQKKQKNNNVMFCCSFLMRFSISYIYTASYCTLGRRLTATHSLRLSLPIKLYSYI